MLREMFGEGMRKRETEMQYAHARMHASMDSRLADLCLFFVVMEPDSDIPGEERKGRTGQRVIVWSRRNGARRGHQYAPMSQAMVLTVEGISVV